MVTKTIDNDVKGGVSKESSEPDKIITITIKKELNITKFAYDVFLNMPENCISLKCTSHKYDKMLFTFYDPEEEKDYVLTRKKIEDGIERFINRCLVGKNEQLRNPDFLFDLSNWSTEIIDMAVQICIFDEVIYG